MFRKTLAACQPSTCGRSRYSRHDQVVEPYGRIVCVMRALTAERLVLMCRSPRLSSSAVEKAAPTRRERAREPTSSSYIQTVIVLVGS